MGVVPPDAIPGSPSVVIDAMTEPVQPCAVEVHEVLRAAVLIAQDRASGLGAPRELGGGGLNTRRSDH